MSFISKTGVELLNSFYLKKVRNLSKLPLHVAVIMDGNGRWATKRNLPRIEGHKAATKTIRKLIEASIQSNIKYLSLFAFSTENWNRPEEEVKAILNLISDQLKSNLPELNENGVRVSLCGDREALPEYLIKAFKEAEEITRENTRLELLMMVNYSGKNEILHAVNSLVKTGTKEEISEEILRANFYCPWVPDPDLIIRTSGEKRISNFYLWQAAYSELYFTEVLFPDFEKYHFYRALLDYSRRKRRFGGLKEY